MFYFVKLFLGLSCVGVSETVAVSCFHSVLVLGRIEIKFCVVS